MFLANKNHRLTETVARYSTLSAEAAQNVFIANISRKRILAKTLIDRRNSISCFPLFSSQMHFLTNHLDSFTGPILSEKLFESTSSVHRLYMILTNEASTADLAFDPTLACWSFSYPALASHNSLSRFSRQDLLLNRTMLSNPFDCVTWIVLAATAIDFQPQTCDAY